MSGFGTGSESWKIPQPVYFPPFIKWKCPFLESQLDSVFKWDHGVVGSESWGTFRNDVVVVVFIHKNLKYE